MPSTPAIDVGSLVARRATITPDRPALTFAGRTLTFRDLGSRVRKLAAALRAGGVQAGDLVAPKGRCSRTTTSSGTT